MARKDKGSVDHDEHQTELFLCSECKSFQQFSHLGECAACEGKHACEKDLALNTQGWMLLVCSGCNATSSVAAGLTLVYCTRCDLRHRGVCGCLHRTRQRTTCCGNCMESGHRVRMLAKLEARKGSKMFDGDVDGGDDVLKVDMEGALDLLEL